MNGCCCAVSAKALVLDEGSKVIAEGNLDDHLVLYMMMYRCNMVCVWLQGSGGYLKMTLRAILGKSSPQICCNLAALHILLILGFMQTSNVSKLLNALTIKRQAS